MEPNVALASDRAVRMGSGSARLGLCKGDAGVNPYDAHPNVSRRCLHRDDSAACWSAARFI